MSETDTPVTAPARTRRNRSLAKAGLVAALGTLAATALIGGKPSRRLHVVSGVALLGLAAWHYSLNVKKKV